MKRDSQCGEIAVRLDPRIYPLDVIYSAAYVLLERFYILLDGDPHNNVIVIMSPKAGSEVKDAEKILHQELINFSFYKSQVDKNSEIRKAIIQRALITSELSGPGNPGAASAGDVMIDLLESSDRKYLEDAEGISIPWDKKPGRAKDYEKAVDSGADVRTRKGRGGRKAE